MRLRKEIILFYALILASVGVIVAADQPDAAAPAIPQQTPQQAPQEIPVKCSKLMEKSVSPVNYISEGFMRLKA